MSKPLPEGYLDSLPRETQPDLESEPTLEMRNRALLGKVRVLCNYLVRTMSVVRHEWGAFGKDDEYAICPYCGRQPEGNDDLGLDMGETGHKKECEVKALLAGQEEIMKLVKD